MEKYIRKIKNPSKKQYATEYYNWLKNGKRGEEPDYTDYKSLSYMAAQAVRMNLDTN